MHQCCKTAKRTKKKQKSEFCFLGYQQQYIGETVSIPLGLLRERWLMLLMVSPRLFSPNSSSSSSSFPSLSQWFHAGGWEGNRKGFCRRHLSTSNILDQIYIKSVVWIISAPPPSSSSPLLLLTSSIVALAWNRGIFFVAFTPEDRQQVVGISANFSILTCKNCTHRPYITWLFSKCVIV